MVTIVHWLLNTGLSSVSAQNVQYTQHSVSWSSFHLPDIISIIIIIYSAFIIRNDTNASILGFYKNYFFIFNQTPTPTRELLKLITRSLLDPSIQHMMRSIFYMICYLYFYSEQMAHGAMVPHCRSALDGNIMHYRVHSTAAQHCTAALQHCITLQQMVILCRVHQLGWAGLGWVT